MLVRVISPSLPQPATDRTGGRIRHRRRAALAIASALAVAGFAITTDGAASASADSLSVRRGQIGDGQSVEALSVADQSGTDDNWTSYVEFFPGSRRHVSILDVTAAGSGADSLDVSLNFRGPDSSENRWRLQVRDRTAGEWIDVFVNDDVDDWVWVDATTKLADAERFLNASGQARLRYFSSNANDVSQLDFVGVDRGQDNPYDVSLPTPNGGFDYQIGGDYEVPDGVATVSRDWFAGTPEAGLYNVCYVNAFQTQDNDDAVDRPDELENWPQDLVLTEYEDDPNWEGEYLIDISTPGKRLAAADHLQQMIGGCATKGYDAVEYDNLDSWTRFDEIESLELPFDRDDSIAFATLITERAHGLGLAVAQKNASDIAEDGSYVGIGFDFAIAEECGRYTECDVFANSYRQNLVIIEYNDSPENVEGFATACAGYAKTHSIVMRDRGVVTPSDPGYFRDDC